MVDDKKKAEKETTRLRQELQDLQAGFAVQKVDYQKQVDDMFFYDYQYCMKKHDIAQNTLTSPPMMRASFQAVLPREADMLQEVVHLVSGLYFFCIYLLWPTVT